MKSIAVLVALVAIPLTAGAAPGEDPELIRIQHHPVPSYQEVDTSKIVSATKLRPPPIVLPDVAAMVAKVRHADPRTLSARVRKSTQVVRFFQNPKRRWMLAGRHEKCVGVPWQRECIIARATVKLHESLAEAATKRLWEIERTIPTTDNWVRAVRYAQKPFPGTQEWLLFISNRECRACYTVPGGFVCNYQGSGACGPMQFMSGTFYGHADDARAYLEAHGFIVDPSVWSWRNALGQALTAAYMRYTHIDGCHWCL